MNILFLLVDSFNTEKFYGDKKTSLTPNLNKLIESGTFFSQAVTCAPVTLPSISSIFTSKYPFESTTLDNNLFNLNQKLPNFIEELHSNGFSTHALLPEGIMHTNIPKLFHNSIFTYESFATLYDGIGDEIIRKLNSESMKEPWFYYIELQDLHGHAEFIINEGPKQFKDKKFGINQYDRMLSAFDAWIGKIIENLDLNNTLLIITADHGSSFALYSQKIEDYEKHTDEIRKHESGLAYKSAHKIITKLPGKLNPIRKKLSEAYTDNKLENLQQKLDKELSKIENLDLLPYEKRLMRDSIIRVPQPFDEHFRIPLLFVGNGVPKNKKITQQVRSIDIFPTIFELSKLKNLPNITGQSLLDLFHEKKLEESPAYLDSAALRKESQYMDTIGIRTSNIKYFRDRNEIEKDVSMFDLKIDVHEENNIIQDNKDLITKMESILESIKSDKNFKFKKVQDLSDDEVKNAKDLLKDLGYV
tara:strand:+ start:125 stop:1546 length:1422 start_codon:yes stop_codon:yes gene_type:complete